MYKNNKWDILVNKIKEYLENIVESFTFNINYNIWNKYIYDSTFSEYFELIEDI